MSKIFVYKNLAENKRIGGKAANLFKLQKMGVNVPKWGVIPADVILNQLPQDIEKEDLTQHFQNLIFPEEIKTILAEYFGEDYRTKTYAVRSSAIDEDGKDFSFAGQFESFLHVSFDDIEEKVKKIWQSVISERVLAYREENNLPLKYDIAVIIQEMVDSDVSGVAFGLDPVLGNKNNKIISAVYGLGEGLVSGVLNADTFTITPNGIQEQLAKETHAFVQDKSGKGIVKTKIEHEKQEKPTLNEFQLNEISNLLDKLSSNLGKPQDIEFAYSNNQLYLLQTRPITAIRRQDEGEYILWDNSNIIESYPGVTTPLTFSFIIKMYEFVYRQFVQLMGVKKKEIEQHADVFANTLGLIRGRVYYNLLSWYKMLAMLPGYSINAEFMEKMMGVKERFELKENYRMNKQLAKFRIVAMIIRMILLQRRLPKERRKFLDQLNNTINQYQAIKFNSLPPKEIISYYNDFEKTLLLKWKAPLINDFFAMIWFGLLQKQTEKYCPNHPNIHNDLLCGSQDIISVQPIYKSIEISTLIRNNEETHKLFKEKSASEIWDIICQNTFSDIKNAIDDYIQKFGERCVGELKLETVSYAQNPVLFIKVIKSYVEQNITQKTTQSNLEDKLRNNAEKETYNALKGKLIKRWWFNHILGKARDVVSNRENLRYERTRGFGMVRNMFTALGKQLQALGNIENSEDIFYLELDEIKAIEKFEFKNELQQKIEMRKKEFDNYKQQLPPQERFFTYGFNFTDEYIYSKEKLEPVSEDLSGIGCCPGRVQARVRIVTDPSSTNSLNGDILVTTSTDPGWVTLFPTASAVIVERGSLLSHSAIVSREMGIPCIVSVTGLLRTLKTGDEVLMDGSTGKIQIIKHG